MSSSTIGGGSKQPQKLRSTGLAFQQTSSVLGSETHDVFHSSSHVRKASVPSVSSGQLGGQPSMRRAAKSLFHEIYGPYYMEARGSLTHSAFSECLQNPSVWRLYELVIESKSLHSLCDAIFYAEKLVSLSDGLAPFVYLLGDCYMLNGDFKKVHSLFLKYKVLGVNANFLLLAARSLYRNKQYDACLALIEETVVTQTTPNQETASKLEALIALLRGQCFEALENKQNAITAYLDCLKKDPTCQEAFKRLADFYLVGATGKEQLLTSLNFKPEDIWVRQFYVARISEDTACKLDAKGMDEESQDLSMPTDDEEDPMQQAFRSPLTTNPQQAEEKHLQRITHSLTRLKNDNLFESLQNKNNIDLLCIKAKNSHAKYDIHKAYEICVKAIKIDPLYFDIIPVYCACLLELNYLGELYYCAHNLVENYATHPLSWFAIATYYYLTKKYEIARKYFQKAIYLDRNFVYAWIGMAHSFAIQDESDQAMNFYRTVSRLFPGCYLAHLYMGMEYLRTNNLKTALLSFQYAKEINGNDPLIYNEIGVIFFKQKNYEEAKKMYLSALSLCKEATSSVVLTVVNNLAHAYRKTKDFKAAIANYEKCIQLDPKNYQTYFALAYTYHISNQLNKAIAFYHKSLYYKHENQFAVDMLDRCLKDASEYSWEAVYDTAGGQM